MADKTKISWAEASWPITTGCTPVSGACDNCYAEVMTATRLAHLPEYEGLATVEGGFTGQVRLHEHRMFVPLRWTRPRRIFVCSMSDLFHEGVPDTFIARAFAVMALADWHTFEVLTKRHARLRSLLSSPTFQNMVWGSVLDLVDDAATPLSRRRRADALRKVRSWSAARWPLPNVWVGVSVEDQKWADIRIPALLETPAVVRWLSCEPLLGPVDLSAYTGGVDWVVAGGESGKPMRRPIARMDPAWFGSLFEQCQAAGIAFHFKQLGSVLAREWGIPGKGANPELWPTRWPQDYPRGGDGV